MPPSPSKATSAVRSVSRSHSASGLLHLIEQREVLGLEFRDGDFPSLNHSTVVIPVSYTHLDVYKRQGCSVSLNLRLPSGQMAVQVKASTATAAVKRAFEDLLQQVNKHKELLRSTHKWTRRQNEASARRNVSVPFEQTLAAVFPAMVSAEDVRSYVNVNPVSYTHLDVYKRQRR